MGQPIEICDNFFDDDGDGLVDEDCPTSVPSGGQPGGSQTVFEICDNFFDDDGDGLVDEDCPTSVPPENVNGSTTFPPENVNGSTTFPPENVNGSTTFPPENVNGSTTFPPENVNGSTTFPPENVNGSTTFPPENVNGSTTFPPENVNGSTTFPPENECDIDAATGNADAITNSNNTAIDTAVDTESALILGQAFASSVPSAGSLECTRAFKNTLDRLPPVHPTCPSPPATPQFRHFSSRIPDFSPRVAGFWQFDFAIVNSEGLVLRGIDASGQRLLDRLSVPHFLIDFGPTSGGRQIIRFCDKTDTFSPLTAPPMVDPVKGIEKLTWFFTKHLDNPEGDLTITYDYFIRFFPVKNCELGKNTCFRFVPTVSYDWIGTDNSPPPKEFKAFYRLDYGQGVALATVKDDDDRGLQGAGPVGFQDFVTTEFSFTATKFDSQGNYLGGTFDNIHSGHIDQTLHVPGCRKSTFDCFHTHWRWGGGCVRTIDLGTCTDVDVLVNPIDDSPIRPIAEKRGNPYLVDDQDITIAIVKFHSFEILTDDPLKLKNNEKLATTTGLFNSLGKPQRSEGTFCKQSCSMVYCNF